LSALSARLSNPRSKLASLAGQCESAAVAIEINGIAHIQLTVNDAPSCVPFWEELCHFFGMQTLLKGDDSVYCIGGRTGVLVRGTALQDRSRRFDQECPGLHHVCFRARQREDVDAVYAWTLERGARIVHPPEDGSRFAPGYYSVLFEDPDGIRIEVNHVPGSGHFGTGGRLGSGGAGPATSYGEDGLTGSRKR
jgi:catechol 2,3-dioxygenase-like lactoylglutathione lyase family enzyme